MDMPDPFKRKLVIRTLDAGVAKGGTLLLTFKPLQHIGLKQQSVARKVIPFPSKAYTKAEVEYNHQSLVFIAPQVDNGNVLSPSTYHSVDVGGAVSYDFDEDGNLVINPTRRYRMPGAIIGWNNTGKIQDISIGLKIDRLDPQGILYFPKVGNDTGVGAKFYPILRAYMTSDYVEGEAIAGEIQTSMIWERDLSDLQDISNWKLTYDANSGMYDLAPDETP